MNGTEFAAQTWWPKLKKLVSTNLRLTWSRLIEVKEACKPSLILQTLKRNFFSAKKFSLQLNLKEENSLPTFPAKPDTLG